jgi:site-specific DNA-methyltransferase (adenine-specific)
MGDVRLMMGDCLERMGEIEAGTVDLIAADLPYQVTACKWDTLIPFEPMWASFRRVLKPDGAIVLTSSQPFTSELIQGNRKSFKYCWYWHKNIVSGFQLAKIQPTRCIEEVCVFYDSQPTYNPQWTESLIRDRARVVGAPNGRGGSRGKNEHRLGTKPMPTIFKESVAPRNCLEIPCVPRATGTLHPTQKPVALFEYLIRTYSNEGETVLDCTMGSGTTGVACINTGRNFIGIERDPAYFAIAESRIAAARSSTPLLAPA